MMMPSLKYCFAALALGAGAWVPASYRTLLVVGVAGLLAGLFVAAIVLDRQMAMRDAQEWEGTATEAGILERAIPPRRVLIIGSGPVAAVLARSLEETGRHRVVGYLDAADHCPSMARWARLGGADTTAEICREHEIDEVFVAPAPTWQQQLAEAIAGTGRANVQVVPALHSTLLDFPAIGSYGDVAVVPLRDPRRGMHEVAKRAFDVMVSLTGLVLAFPALLAIAALIRVTSPGGPALFAQERVGRYGKRFVLYKFRTMVPDAEARTGPILSSGEDDDRLTPLGRWLRAFRVDELPQLWNVLVGEMSMVGPRPERPCFVSLYVETIPGYAQRHLVRPGITGLAQVCGGYHTTPADKLRFDLAYVAHRSLLYDLSILYRTIAVVSRPKIK